MNQRITLKDIAKLAGVSAGTVDRVIHGRGNVSFKAREKIEKVMRELDYEPNIIASTLAYNRTIRVAALMPDYRNDLYWEQPKHGMERAYLAVRHYGLKLEMTYFPMFDPADFKKKAIRILENAPEAFLFPPLFAEESAEVLAVCKERHIPAVLINTNLEDQQALCYIGQDSYQSGVLAGKLLNFTSSGSGMTLLLNLDKQIMHAKHLLDKERGIRDYFLRAYGHDHQIVRADFEDFDQPAALREFMEHLFGQYPGLSGIFVTNSRAYKILDALGSLFPKHVKIVGFDLLPPNIAYLNRNNIAFLINQNPVQQGYQAVMNIVNHLIFKKTVERVQYLPLDIVVTENAHYYLEKELAFQLVV